MGGASWSAVDLAVLRVRLHHLSPCSRIHYLVPVKKFD